MVALVLAIGGCVGAWSAPGRASDWARVGVPIDCHTLPRGYRCSATTQIHFAYPRGWGTLDSQFFFSLMSPLIWVSTEPFEEPCSFTRDSDGVSVLEQCRWPVVKLRPNGVFIQWATGVRLGGWSLAMVTGEKTRIGRRPAKIALNDPDLLPMCKTLGADASVTAWVLRLPGSFYVMTACLAGPDINEVERQVRTVLSTTEFPWG